MKAIIIKSNKFLDSISWFFKVGGITLFPFIIIRPYAKKSTINHESIHIAQYSELLVVGFLLIYLWDWVYGLIKYRNPKVAYKQIRFEQEAYKYARSYSYLNKRKKFNWTKFRV